MKKPGSWVLWVQLGFTPSHVIVSFLVLFSIAGGALSDEPKPGDCEPRHCGNGRNISYPFWITGVQLSYCGYPGFEIDCKDDAPVVVSDGGNEYFVQEIFYDNNSVILSSASLSSSPCPYPRRNMSLSRTPFNISFVNGQLFFYLNCTQSLPGSSWAISCADNQNGRVSFVREQPLQPYEIASRSCESVFFFPFLLAYGAGGDGSYKQLLRNGFLLEWEAPDCSRCENSGGRCGYNQTSNLFMCICNDRVHRVDCDPNETSSRGDRILHLR